MRRYWWSSLCRATGRRPHPEAVASELGGPRCAGHGRGRCAALASAAPGAEPGVLRRRFHMRATGGEPGPLTAMGTTRQWDGPGRPRFAGRVRALLDRSRTPIKPGRAGRCTCCRRIAHFANCQANWWWRTGRTTRSSRWLPGRAGGMDELGERCLLAALSRRRFTACERDTAMRNGCGAEADRRTEPPTRICSSGVPLRCRSSSRPGRAGVSRPVAGCGAADAALSGLDASRV